MEADAVRFAPGQLVRHLRFGYRGVVVDVDPSFQGTDAWYAQMAVSKPPRDRPWYRVLVHEAVHETYVAERNLAADAGGQPIEHPFLAELFAGFEDGRYTLRRAVN